MSRKPPSMPTRSDRPSCRRPYGTETRETRDDGAVKYIPRYSATCPDCGVARGQLHEDGCDVEQCPECRTQLITCDHAQAYLDEDAVSWVFGPTVDHADEIDERIGALVRYDGDATSIECRLANAERQVLMAAAAATGDDQLDLLNQADELAMRRRYFEEVVP